MLFASPAALTCFNDPNWRIDWGRALVGGAAGRPFVCRVWLAMTLMASQVSRHVGMIWKEVRGCMGRAYLVFGKEKAVPDMIFGPKFEQEGVFNSHLAFCPIFGAPRCRV